MIADIYAQVPEVNCKGLCGRSCGPIACSATEADAMRDNGINPPGVRNHPTEGPATCSHLTDGLRCAIYEHRPMVCRLFGAVKALRCIHGCKPDRWLSDDKARELLAQLQDGRPVHEAIPGSLRR